ncbi:YceI family protein [Candidatus Sulfurimonas baltica]|uniref:YceI family protein n=1 Tax=Candidatus Sulfurimonas baltica TaxID=2740404 RepID=A0A7S7LV11_9BACT|nr:YceI family protein [Candidatus Sulfurimonas baltica]QOY52014.1 YceI family protein [Candidatus Sulfurimonas baltica]
MKNLLIVLLLSLPLLAMDLKLKDGSVVAHTEMMMDSEINPTNNSLKAELSIQNNDITTIKGKFWVDMIGFISNKTDRDESMYKEVEADKFKDATYTILDITKKEAKDSYTINGTMSFHGQERPLSANADIKVENGSLVINASTMILVSDFGIEMPCMVFMCVRDQVDLAIKASF